MREMHEPAPLLRVIRAKCLDCSAGVESEIRKCTAIGCALWPYRMATNPFRAPREMTPEQREAGAARLAAARARGRSPSETGAPVGQHGNYQGKNDRDDLAGAGYRGEAEGVQETAFSRLETPGLAPGATTADLRSIGAPDWGFEQSPVARSFFPAPAKRPLFMCLPCCQCKSVIWRCTTLICS
jgi:hypothetical protein